jgi:hypothetical protein
MSIPHILTFPTPLRSKPLLRRYNNTGKKLHRGIRLKLRACKRMLTQAARRHYFLPAAYRDMRKAVAHNEDIVIAAAASTFILVYACAVVAVDFVIAFSRVTYAVAESTEVDMGLFILGLGPTILLFCSLLVALAINFMSIAVMDGANRKVYRSIRSTFKRSLGLSSRITSAWYLLGFVHFFRLFVVAVPIYFYIKIFSDIAILSPAALIAVGVVALAWWFNGLMRYSLVPYVATFEPQYLLTQAFGRSRELTKQQARTFIITGSIVFAAYIVGLLKLGAYLRDDIGIATNLFFALGILIGIMTANAAMVMLYRKRKLARA